MIEFKPNDQVRTLCDRNIKKTYGTKEFHRTIKAGTIGTVKDAYPEDEGGRNVQVVFGYATLALGEEQACDANGGGTASEWSYYGSNLELVE